jgi:exopolysaccharide biosynthesis polyprenyl glycosylphosphotransferase
LLKISQNLNKLIEVLREQSIKLISLTMQNQNHIASYPIKNLISLLNLLINPNSFLLKDESLNECVDFKFDLRSSSGLKIVGRKIVYLFRTLFLIFVDNLVVVISWISINQVSKLVNGKDFFINFAKVEDYHLLLIVVLINLSISFASDLYSTRDRSRKIRHAVKACSLTYVVFSSIVWIFYEKSSIGFFSISTVVSTYFLNLCLICIERFVLFKAINYIRNCFIPLRRKIMLVGVGEDIENCQKLFTESKTFSIVEILDLSHYKNDSYFDKIYQQVSQKNLDEVFVCSWEKVRQQTKFFWTLQTSGISWRILPIKQSIPQKNPELADVEGIPTIRYATPAIVGIDFLLKRIFDLTIATLLLIFLGLPMLLIGLLIKLDSPGSIFYKQTRVGLKGEYFQVWKFRTMVENASQLQKELELKNEVSGGILFKIADDPRITFIGKFLRHYSLDELPQLFNVLRGEMTLVGPRPLPIRDVAKFADHHHFRHEVLPGITGLWQVNGRSDTDSDRVFNFDFQYIQNWSLALDLKILLKTVLVVLFGKGAY